MCYTVTSQKARRCHKKCYIAHHQILLKCLPEPLIVVYAAPDFRLDFCYVVSSQKTISTTFIALVVSVRP